ncbi:MAG: HAMP domain-containing histidine kinase [Clostridia bacterium]|nr:HAMP domain-containing histidine kinase [Clostridia bacterium]NCC44547.1 HAMP domain-containing histidine kinase [Clostridia bacterium]
MKAKFIKSFEERLALYIGISALITLVVEVCTVFLIRLIAGKLRYMGYRSALMSPDGINPSFRLGILLAVGILVFIFSFYFLVQKYMRYVRIIINGMKDIAQGDFDKDIPVESMDEFGQIAGYLNQMEENIKVIMERERIAEHTKNDLISSVAHDLRTPLTSIIGYLGWVKEQPDLDVQVRQKYLDIAYRKAQHLEQMTNELFGFVKLEHREMSLQMGILNLSQLLAQLLDECVPSFEKYGLETEYICSDNQVMLEGDGNLLARLYDNLLNNAIKYGKDGKMIRVELEKRGDYAVTRVINYGYVIPQEDIANIFRKFYRVEQSRSQDTGGTGLGLAIVQQIAELHQGTVSVKSSLQGTVFEVTLPLNQGIEEQD